MNIPLERLIEGIIATMRSDVIPHVTDSYARGQAVGVIDLLNNIAPRVEWAREPLENAVSLKIALLSEVAQAGYATADPILAGTGDGSVATLLERRAALDAALGDAVASLWTRRDEAKAAEMISRIRTHFRDAASIEMKMTKTPLFAEIASGSDGKSG